MTDDQPDLTADPEIAAANKRIEKALKGYDWLNQARREDGPVYQPPPQVALAATLAVLEKVVTDAGLATVLELARAKAGFVADTLEEGLRQCKEHKRAQTGLVTAQPGDVHRIAVER